MIKYTIIALVGGILLNALTILSYLHLDDGPTRYLKQDRLDMPIHQISLLS